MLWEKVDHNQSNKAKFHLSFSNTEQYHTCEHALTSQALSTATKYSEDRYLIKIWLISNVLVLLTVKGIHSPYWFSFSMFSISKNCFHTSSTYSSRFFVTQTRNTHTPPRLVSHLIGFATPYSRENWRYLFLSLSVYIENNQCFWWLFSLLTEFVQKNNFNFWNLEKETHFSFGDYILVDYAKKYFSSVNTP